MEFQMHFMLHEKDFSSNNACYMMICLCQCMQMDSKYVNTYETLHWGGMFGYSGVLRALLV